MRKRLKKPSLKLLIPRRLGAVTLVLALLGLTAGGLAQLRVDTGISSFLPASDPSLSAMNEKADSFGGDPIVVFLESDTPGELLSDRGGLNGMLRLEGKLSKIPDVARVYGPATGVNQVAGSGQNLIAQISGRRDGLRQAAVKKAQSEGASPKAADAAGQAAVKDFDIRYGKLLVQAMPVGLPTLSNPRFAQSVVFNEHGQVRPQWRAVVPSPTSVAILIRPQAGLNQSRTSKLVDSVRGVVAGAKLPAKKITVSGAPTVTAALARRASHEFPLLGVLAIFAVGLIYFLARWSVSRRSRLRPLIAALLGTTATLGIFGWLGHPVSLGVVAFVPILLGIGSDFPLYLAQPSRRRGVLVAALGGAGGFGALAASPLPFVRELGIALALGILATVGAGLWMTRTFDLVQPAMVSPRWTAPHRTKSDRWRMRVPALILALSLAALGWTALPNLHVEARPDRLAQGLPELNDAAYVQGGMGAAGEVNVVLKGNNVLTPEALSWTRNAESVINRNFSDQFRTEMTLPQMFNFLGPEPTQEQVNAASELVPPYLSSAVLRPDHRMSLMVLGLNSQDAQVQGQTIDRLHAALPPPPPGFHVELAGLPVAAASGYTAVSHSEIVVNVLAVVVTGAILLLGLRRRADAGRALLTVILSSGWVLALAWATIGTLNPLTMAVGALTTATGCEFAMIRIDARRLGQPWLIRSVALAACAAAAGYLVLLASDLSVLRELGLVLAAGVLSSWVAAVVVMGVLFPLETQLPRHDRDSSRPELVRGGHGGTIAGEHAGGPN